jgi:Ser-tRNA(Ala) deacylase AlaX
VVLEVMVFYPQGGGQPADTGVISAGGARFLVQDVRMKGGQASGLVVGAWAR